MLLAATTDKIQIVTSAAVTVDVHATYMDLLAGAVTPGRLNTAITTATTTDVVAAPAASTYRTVVELFVRNKHASTSVDVTVVFDQNATDFEMFKVTLLAGQTLEYKEGVGFYVVAATAKLSKNLRVTADYVNATTSFSDITGLTWPVESGKHYNFFAHLYHRSDATTSGSQFGINGPAMTLMSINAIQQITASVTAATYGSSAAVTALETAAVVETTGPGANTFLAILSGYINPSAAGTFAVRGKSEVAVAAGLTVKQGSFCRLWEADN